MITILLVCSLMILHVCLYLLAFPEVSGFFFLSITLLFPMDNTPMIDPTQGAAQFGSFQWVYPFATFMRDHIYPLHPVFRLLFIIVIIGSYFLLAKFVHIKRFYFVRFIGIPLISYLIYLALSKGFLLDQLWCIFLTVISTIILIGLRESVFSPRRK